MIFVWSFAKKQFLSKTQTFFKIIPFFQGNGSLVSGIPSFRRPPDDGGAAAQGRKPEGGNLHWTGHKKGAQSWPNCPASSVWPRKKPLIVAEKRHFTRVVDRDVSEPESCQMTPVAGRSFDTTPAYRHLYGLVTSGAFLREDE